MTTDTITPQTKTTTTNATSADASAQATLNPRSGQASQQNNSAPLTPSSPSTQAGSLRVIRRNGSLTPFNKDKISVAMTKAFLTIEKDGAEKSSRIHALVDQLTQQIATTLERRFAGSGIVHIEDIQDQVELALMRSGEHKTAREYVIYREARRKEREAKSQPKNAEGVVTLNVTLANGKLALLDVAKFKQTVSDACANLAEVTPGLIIKDTLRNLYEGVAEMDARRALVMTARTLIEREPNYSFVAARLLLDTMRTEALSFLGLQSEATQADMNELYSSYFQAYIQRGIDLKRLSPKLAEFDMKKITTAIEADRDLNFTYLGLQTLYDRYFIHSDEIRFELPQAFFMRVAMGLAIEEDDREKRAIEFYHMLSSFSFMSSTPTLFNSGTLRSQLSSCYLSTVPDDLEGIYGAIKDNALLSKYAGGLGNDWTPVRAMNSHIQGTNGKSQGVVPFLKVANDTAVAVNQGGKRKGALCSYLATHHLDVEEFIELRKNTGDERRRTHDMNTANWIPDLFVKRVINEGEWTLFSPEETPDLHDLYGSAFETAYLAYEQQAEKGEIKNFKKLPAINLWRKMLGMLFETGHPWFTFKDPCNIRSPQQHSGVVHSSNLCTEITLNTTRDEIAVCNLGSINLPAHVDQNGLQLDKLERTINTAIRMLDNVIDINFYSVPQAKKSNLRHRPIGIGLMGFQDALYQQSIPYSSDEAITFADRSMEAISYYAIQASNNLAKERGSYETFPGSLWSQGILPIDSIALLEKERGAEYLDQDRSHTLDWDVLREKVKTIGMRNSNVMAIAPTATISNICGVAQSIEPTYQNLYVKSNLSGEFTVVNPHLVNDLKKANLWDEVMVNDLKYFDGNLQSIERVPEYLKQLYATAFDIDPRWLIEAASRRQKWLDQSQSLNLYMKEPSGKKLDTMYRMAWKKGLKTTYYLRSMGATSAERFTVNDGALNAVKVGSAAPAACSIDDPDCEACQ